MIIGAGANAVLGFAFWWFAVHLCPLEVIGVTSALISLMGVVGIIGESGLDTLLIGEIVRWPARKDGLVSAAILVGVSISLAVGAASLLLAKVALSSTTVQASIADDLVFLIGCGLTGFSMIIDQAFVGMLRGALRMLRQAFYAISRLCLLVFLSLYVTNSLAILGSWVVSLGASLIFGELLMRAYGLSLFHRPDFDLLWRLRRRALDHYLLDLGNVISPVIMPYLVAVVISPASNAEFTMIWLVVQTAALVPSVLATVLFPVLRSEPAKYRNSMRLSLTASLLFAGVFGAFIFFFSHELLRLFSPEYARIGGDDLRLIGFSLLGSVVKYHVTAAFRLSNRMRQLSFWACLAGLIELTAVFIGGKLGGLWGLSTTWSLVMLVEGMAMVLFANPCRPQTLAVPSTP